MTAALDRTPLRTAPLAGLLLLPLLLAAAACSDSAVAPPGGACGGRGGAVCPADQYCDFPRNACGADDVPGVCKPRPDTCPLLLVAEPTCGCDGHVYSSACDATLGGADLDASGACRLEPGAFACGYRQCNLASRYCIWSTSDVGGEPDAYNCLGLPSCPGGASCACLASQPCGTMCTGSAAAGLTLTCPGG